MGLLTREDSTLYRGFFKEMARLRGIPVKYYYPARDEMTIHSEILPEYSSPIEMDIIFETNPKVKTLKAIRWVSENPDDKPYIAMIPFDAPNLQTKCIIEIPPIGSVDSPRRFEITTINTLIEFPDCWTCTLAPLFDNDKVKNDYGQTNYNYTDTKDQPDRDAPDNELNHPYNNKNYGYLRVGVGYED